MSGGDRGARWAAALALTLALPAPVPAQDQAAAPSASIRVDLKPGEITVGDPVAVTLSVEWPAGAPDVEPRFPAWQDTWGRAELLHIGEVTRGRSAGGDVVFSQLVLLTAYHTGEVTLPPLSVAIPVAAETQTLSTPRDLRFTVVSVLPAGEQAPAARAPSGLRGLPIGQRFAWSAGLLAAAVLAAAVLVARRRPLAASAVPAAPRLPPLEELLQGLGILAPGVASEVAHTHISRALRTYLGRVTGVQAVERTTTEIQRQLRGNLDPGLAQRAVRLLRNCDQAKFVPGLEVAAGEIGARLRETQAIARGIEDSLRPQDDEAEAGDDGRQGAAAGAATGAPGAVRRADA